MRILLTNDDGFHAAGLNVLAESLNGEHEVWVVAPVHNASGCSHSITLTRTLHAHPHGNRRFAVDGTPADCVQLALGVLMPERPDIVISGINRGSNLGDDTLYSGTVAGAMEARFLRLPPIAVSVCDPNPDHYQTAAAVIADLLPSLEERDWPAQTVLNVNVPDLQYESLAGTQLTRLGRRGEPKLAESVTNPRDVVSYWIGPAGDPDDVEDGSDFAAIAAGNVSVTPLLTDLTDHGLLATLRAEQA